MQVPHVLAIDIGTSALKAVLYDGNGRFLATATHRYGYSTPAPGWAEANPAAWWQAVVAALADLQAQQWDLQAVQTIGFTGQMHTLVLLDKAGEVLPPTILWLDRRAVEETAVLTQQLGLPPCHLNSTYSLPKLLWLAQHKPEIMARTATILWPKDYLRYRFTGERLTDPTDAAGAALLDRASGTWATDRLTAIGLDPAILPPIRLAHEDAGPLLPNIAADLGLSPTAQVIVGAGDIIALLGGAPPQAGRLTCSLGSSCMIASPLAADQSLDDPKFRVYTNWLPPYRLLNGVLSTSGAALTWAWQTLYGKEIALENVMAEAAAQKPGGNGLFFLPYLAGERTPYWNDNLRGGFYGLTLAHSKPQMVRSVLEGVAYGLRQVIEISAEVGIKLNEIALSGGGAMLPDWCQIIADVCQLPVRVFCGQETVTRPLYAYCAVADTAGIDFEEALLRTFEEEPQIYEPDRRVTAVYDPIYLSYCTLADFVAVTKLPAFT